MFTQIFTSIKSYLDWFFSHLFFIIRSVSIFLLNFNYTPTNPNTSKKYSPEAGNNNNENNFVSYLSYINSNTLIHLFSIITVYVFYGFILFISDFTALILNYRLHLKILNKYLFKKIQRYNAKIINYISDYESEVEKKTLSDNEKFLFKNNIQIYQNKRDNFVTLSEKLVEVNEYYSTERLMFVFLYFRRVCFPDIGIHVFDHYKTYFRINYYHRVFLTAIIILVIDSHLLNYINNTYCLYNTKNIFLNYEDSTLESFDDWFIGFLKLSFDVKNLFFQTGKILIDCNNINLIDNFVYNFNNKYYGKSIDLDFVYDNYSIFKNSNFIDILVKKNLNQTNTYKQYKKYDNILTKNDIHFKTIKNIDEISAQFFFSLNPNSKILIFVKDDETIMRLIKARFIESHLPYYIDSYKIRMNQPFKKPINTRYYTGQDYFTFIDTVDGTCGYSLALIESDTKCSLRDILKTSQNTLKLKKTPLILEHITSIGLNSTLKNPRILNNIVGNMYPKLLESLDYTYPSIFVKNQELVEFFNATKAPLYISDKSRVGGDLAVTSAISDIICPNSEEFFNTVKSKSILSKKEDFRSNPSVQIFSIFDDSQNGFKFKRRSELELRDLFFRANSILNQTLLSQRGNSILHFDIINLVMDSIERGFEKKFKRFHICLKSKKINEILDSVKNLSLVPSYSTSLAFTHNYLLDLVEDRIRHTKIEPEPKKSNLIMEYCWEGQDLKVNPDFINDFYKPEPKYISISSDFIKSVHMFVFDEFYKSHFYFNSLDTSNKVEIISNNLNINNQSALIPYKINIIESDYGRNVKNALSKDGMFYINPYHISEDMYNNGYGVYILDFSNNNWFLHDFTELGFLSDYMRNRSLNLSIYAKNYENSYKIAQQNNKNFVSTYYNGKFDLSSALNFIKTWLSINNTLNQKHDSDMLEDVLTNLIQVVLIYIINIIIILILFNIFIKHNSDHLFYSYTHNDYDKEFLDKNPNSVFKLNYTSSFITLTLFNLKFFKKFYLNGVNFNNILKKIKLFFLKLFFKNHDNILSSYKFTNVFDKNINLNLIRFKHFFFKKNTWKPIFKRKSYLGFFFTNKKDNNN